MKAGTNGMEKRPPEAKAKKAKEIEALAASD